MRSKFRRGQELTLHVGRAASRNVSESGDTYCMNDVAFIEIASCKISPTKPTPA